MPKNTKGKSGKKTKVKKEAPEQYEVERILDKKVNGLLVEYKVKWVGYKGPTWEAAANVASCTELLAEFEEEYAKKPNEDINQQQQTSGISRSRIEVDEATWRREESPKHVPSEYEDLIKTELPIGFEPVRILGSSKLSNGELFFAVHFVPKVAAENEKQQQKEPKEKEIEMETSESEPEPEEKESAENKEDTDEKENENEGGDDEESVKNKMDAEEAQEENPDAQEDGDADPTPDMHVELISGATMKKQCPLMLINYYERNAIFLAPNFSDNYEEADQVGPDQQEAAGAEAQVENEHEAVVAEDVDMGMGTTELSFPTE